MPEWPSVPSGVPKMIRYSVIEAWRMIIEPIAPPALLSPVLGRSSKNPAQIDRV